MKHWFALTGILLLGVAAITVSQRRKVDVPPGPAAILYLVADTEQELTRMPVRFTRMSDEEEISIGNGLTRTYASEREAGKDPQVVEVEQYLSQVGSRLAVHAHRKLPYKFHYVPDDNFVNAFALPGGHVYVGSGMLALMDSEDELASVIGHEIEHIDHYHCAERVQQEQALRKLPLGGLVALPVSIFVAGYSKDQELEADREGTRLAVEAGYSANGAIRMFETFQRLYDEYQGRAKTPQDEVASVALQTLSGYFRSHPLPSERIAQVQTLVATEHWEARPERDLAVAFIFQTNSARNFYDAHRYQQAAALATRSLQTHPNQPKALQVLAEAEFAQAHFADAADAYRRMLDLGQSTSDLVNRYALSLAAADRQTAAQVFRKWTDSRGEVRPLSLRVPLAGLELLRGEPAAARQLQSELNGLEGDMPLLKADLGWWYYLAGDAANASSLLEQAAQVRPGDLSIGTRRAWAEIEQQRLGDALQSMNLVYEEGRVLPERMMVRAVAKWQSEQPNDALSDYQAAIQGQPEWTNPLWIRPLYSAKVAEAVEQMRNEQEKRRKAQTARSR